VLSELKAGDVPSLLLLNKIDRLEAGALDAVMEEHPDAVPLSAHRPEDVAMLHERISSFFEREMVEAELQVAYSDGRLVNRIHESCRVLAEEHEEFGTRLKIRANPIQIEELVSEGAKLLK
jgi:GTP-binding protein HflX